MLVCLDLPHHTAGHKWGPQVSSGSNVFSWLFYYGLYSTGMHLLFLQLYDEYSDNFWNNLLYYALLGQLINNFIAGFY